MNKAEKDALIAATAAINAEIEATPGYAEVERQMRAEYAIAKAIAKAKEASKMTQAQIAVRMGTTQSCVSRILKGRNLSLNNVQRFFEACGGDLVITFRPKQAN